MNENQKQQWESLIQRSAEYEIDGGPTDQYRLILAADAHIKALEQENAALKHAEILAESQNEQLAKIEALIAERDGLAAQNKSLALMLSQIHSHCRDQYIHVPGFGTRIVGELVYQSPVIPILAAHDAEVRKPLEVEIKNLIALMDRACPSDPMMEDNDGLSSKCRWCRAPGMTFIHHANCAWANARTAITRIRKERGL